MKTASLPIAFNQTALQAKLHKRILLKKTAEVIQSGTFLGGEQTENLEKNLTNYFGAGYVTSVASGHDAIILALSALSLTAEDEVIVPINAYPTLFPVFLSGAKPVPIDCDENGQLDGTLLEKKITKRTKAVIMVHLYGLTGNISAVKKLLPKHVSFIEDAAQAFGTTYHDRLVGTWGDIGCFSFYPTKNLGALGDGGAIWTKNKKLSEFFRMTKMYGEKIRYRSEFIAGHSRLPELQAAFLNVYLKNIKKEVEQKAMLYDYYIDQVHQKNLDKHIRVLSSHKKSHPLVHLLVARVDQRTALRKYLMGKNIPTLIHYPYLASDVPAFRKSSWKKEHFPVASDLVTNIVSLPFHSYLTKDQIRYIIEAIKDFYG